MPTTIMEDVQAIFAVKSFAARRCPRPVCRRHRRCLPPPCGPRFYKCVFMPEEVWAPFQRDVGLAVRRRHHEFDAERMRAEAEAGRALERGTAGSSPRRGEVGARRKVCGG